LQCACVRNCFYLELHVLVATGMTILVPRIVV
jgi:hypothetical protein